MRSLFLIVAFIFWCLTVVSQVIINEGSYRNYSQIYDSNDDNPDWIELYNAGTQSINIGQYGLSDDRTQLRKWVIPSVVIAPQQWLVVFASGNNSNGDGISNWQTAVREDHIWKWINPDASTGPDWMQPGFNDANWQSGQGGFGFGDNDDNTTFASEKSCVYTRIKFNITDTSAILAAVLHVDYDDGFVAYLNGSEIARANINDPVTWNSYAASTIEPIMINGQIPHAFDIDIETIKLLCIEGENTLAVECHNGSQTSSDMTLRTFLTFGLVGNSSQFGQVPDWFNLQTEQGFHTNFKISNNGETIYLTNSSGALIDTLALPANLPFNYSYGSATDGSATRAIFINATPGSSNQAQTAYTNGFEPEPVFSHSGGLYSGSVSVTLTTNSATAQIRYTTNGERPTSSSSLYNGPININFTKVLKAACFSTVSKLPSRIVTNTYFIDYNETPAGILSISMNNNDLYGESGIYDNWQSDWKKPCYIEYYKPESHNMVFKQNSGIRIDGGAGGSRSNPQKSFRVEPGNGALGDGDVDYKLIPAKPNRDSYETFYIRNGSNQYLLYPCKDAIETRCMAEETKNDYSGYTPLQVFLNGQYWGYYELREKLDEDYYKQYYNTNEDSLEILSVSYWYGGQLRAVEGKDPVGRFNSDYQQFLALDPQSDNFWEQADELFDLEYYTDYIAAQTWIADTDWPFNNIRIHRSPETGKRWRFNLIDLEWSLAAGNSWTTSSFDHINYMLYYDQSYPYIHIWQRAMQNSRFRNYFINRLADLMNTTWRTDRLKSVANEIYNQTRPEMPATFERWGWSSVETHMDQFDDAHALMLSELQKRTINVRTHMRNNLGLTKNVSVTLDIEPAGTGYIKISTIKPDEYPWTGIYFDGEPVKVEAIAKPGYYFDRWENNSIIENTGEPVFFDNISSSVTFKAYFVENTQTGLITVSEINYNSEPSIDSEDWIELWNFSKTTATDLSGWLMTDDDPAHIFTFPENIVLEAGARLVITRDQDAFEALYPNVNTLPNLPFGLGNKGDAVKLYDKEMNLIVEVNYTDSTPWPLGADGQGRTLELLNPHNPSNDPANWFDGCIGGSPGTAYTPCTEPIVFSEIQYNSNSGLNTDDWVEIRNTGKLPVNISGWKFMDDTDSTTHEFYISEGTILAPGQNLVLAQDLSSFSAINNDVDNVVGSFNFGLSNSGEWIRMYDKSEKLRLSVRYNDKEPWSTKADGEGFTLELLDSLGLMNSGTNWFAGCFGGSPGSYFTLPCKTDNIANEPSKPVAEVYPNPFSNKLNIKLKGSGNAVLELYSFTGQKLLTLNVVNDNHVLELGSLPNGLYLLSINGLQNRETIRIIKQ